MEQVDVKIGIVVVVFNVDAAALIGKLRCFEGRFAVTVVDNTPDASLNIDLPNVAYIPLRENTGIANAQNVGIRNLLDRGCSHIVFFDQDSEYSLRYVEAIVSEYMRIASLRDDMFILGPTVVDKDSKEEYKSLSADGMADASYIIQRELISSGTCVSASRISQVGMLQSSMFIDYVDFEWCWRAESKGLVSVMTRNVTLPHKVGKGQKRVLGCVFIESAPFRYFYQYRNLIALCRLNYVPKSWKYKKLLRKVIELFVMPVISKNGNDILKNSLRGIAAGLKFRWQDTNK